MWEELCLGYTESTGLPQLRQAVSEAFYQHVKPDDLLVVTPEEGIYIAMRALLAPGDHIIVTFPGYQSLYEVQWRKIAHNMQTK